MAIAARGPQDSRSFGLKRPYAFSHTLGQGYGKELRDLREDVDEAFRNMEGRSEFPQISWVDTSVGSAGLTGGVLVVRGTNLLQGQDFESYTHGTGNAALFFEALKPGKFNHLLSITDTGALSVAYSGVTLAITVNAGVTTANAVATAVNAAGSACHGVIRCVAGGTGAGFPAALAETAFDTGEVIDGFGAGLTVYVSGTEALPYHAPGTTPTASVTDTAIAVEMPDLTGLTPPVSARDPMVVSLVSDGTYTNDLVTVVNDLRLNDPQLFGVDNSADTYNAGGGDVTFDGVGLLQGQTFDTLAYGVGASALTFTAVKPGVSGLSVEILDTAPPNVTVALAAGVITIEYNSGVHTANDIATAVNVAGSFTKNICRCVSGGAGAVVALAETPLAGGAGSGFTFYFGGEEALPAHAAGTTPAATVSDTAVTVTVPDPMGLATPRAAEDVIVCQCVSDGNPSNTVVFKEKGARALLPELHWINVAGGLGGVPTAAGGDLDIYGANLLQGQTFDTYTHGAGASELVISALKPGVSGITIEMVDDGTHVPTVAAVGLDFTVHYDGPANTNNSKASHVSTAINAAAACDGIIRCVGAGGGDVAALAATPLAGGVGSGFFCYISGVEALPANEAGTGPVQKINDGRIVVTVPNLTALGDARAANDVATIHVVSDGVISTVNLTGVLA